jgi:hypothetical protein
MSSRFKQLLPILTLSLLPTLLIWIPFFLRLNSFWGIPLPQEGMATVVANYDGPLFIVVAKTLYNPDLVGNFPFTLPAIYYTAHFPLFPILIKSISLFLGYSYAMLAITLMSSILAIYFFNKLIKDHVKKEDVLWLTFLYSILPARWLIVRSVGSSEPLFIASTIATFYYFKNKNYIKAGIWGMLAQLTKSVGILIFISLLLSLFVPHFQKFANKSLSGWIKSINYKNYLPILMIPLSLIGLFLVYKIQFNDFFAYFHSGDNIHLFFPPFQIFNYSQPWVGTFWLEEIIFVYLIGILGLLRLVKQRQTLFAWFVGIFFTSILFVSHRDLIRYSLPIVPFLLVGFSKDLVKKEFKIATAVLIIPIYLFSLAYISKNVMPIADWAPLL